MVKSFLISVFVSISFSTLTIADSTNQITFDARINGHLVRLVFDTGAESLMLFRTTAERLGLKLTEPQDDLQPPKGMFKAAISEECLVEFGEVTHLNHLPIVDLPDYIRAPGIDGVLGWGTINQNVVEIYPEKKKIIIHNKLSVDTSQWICWNIRSDLNNLVVEIPKKDGEKGYILIDTGSPYGVSLNTDRWQQWIQENPNQHSTLFAVSYLGQGLLIIEEKWAKKLTLGELTFTDVPVSKGVQAGEGIIGEGLDAILGLQALSCCSWIVDGTAGKIYIKSNLLKRSPQNYQYNRLGVVFVPEDIRKSNALIAHVVETGPAYSAGIRNGDVLLKVDDLNVTRWRTDPSILPLSRFWSQPSGTELILIVMRDGKPRKVKVTLQEIFNYDRSSTEINIEH